jgi:RimJ/RimL family protein N-acetyltransferase
MCHACAVRSAPPETLHTPRLTLEPLERAHAKTFFAALRGEASYEFTADRAPASVQTLARQYRPLETRRSPDGRESCLNWALWSASGGRYIGLVQATVHPDHMAYVAHVLFHEAWTNGYAREASAAVIDHLHDEWGVSDIWAAVEMDHRRSIALHEALGFLRVAVHRNAETIRGALSDEYVYRLSLDRPSFQFIA